MATLKDHQAAMVDLLASGSGIPASASRLAHATFDILEMLMLANLTPAEQQALIDNRRPDATTPGLNDKALSKPQKALKTDSPAKWPTPAEQRVKELENTIKQLKGNLAKARAEIQWLKAEKLAVESEQAGCRKEDTQACEHGWVSWHGGECPLAADTVVEYEMRDGTGPGEFVEAGDLRWIHKNWHVDIVKYRIVIGAVL